MDEVLVAVPSLAVAIEALTTSTSTSTAASAVVRDEGGHSAIGSRVCTSRDVMLECRPSSSSGGRRLASPTSGLEGDDVSQAGTTGAGILSPSRSSSKLLETIRQSRQVEDMWAESARQVGLIK
jgi:hypothetical protein